MKFSRALYLFPLIGAVSELPALCRTYSFPNWELTAEGLLVERRGIRKEKLITPLRCGCRSPLSSTRSVKNFDWEPGVRGFIRYMPSKHRTVEISGTWIQDFESTAEKTSASSSFNYLFPAGYTVDYFNAQRVKAEYTSRFYDSEINYWGNFSPRNVNYASLCGVVGIRSMFLGEHFTLTYFKGNNAARFLQIYPKNLRRFSKHSRKRRKHHKVQT